MGITPAQGARYNLYPGCNRRPPQSAASGDGASLTVMVHDLFSVTESIVRKFEQDNQVKLLFLKSGDAGSALNRAILSKDAPMADVFYGVDNTFLSRALEAGIYEPYQSPLLARYLRSSSLIRKIALFLSIMEMFASIMTRSISPNTIFQFPNRCRIWSNPNIKICSW